MKYTTETGRGYLTDADGKVVARVQGPPGEHEAADGLTFNELQVGEQFPDVDPAYTPSAPKGFDEKVRDVLREEGLI